MRRRWLLAAMLLSAASPASAAVKNPDTLIFADSSGFESLDPAWSQNMSPLFNVYEPLVDFNGSGTTLADLRPVLASAVPTRANGLISEDYRVYRFPIRRGVHFSDGTTLTPEDVRYSLLRFMLLDRPGGPAAALLEPILGLASTRENGRLVADAGRRAFQAVTADAGSVTVRLARPFSPFLLIVANFGRVVSKDWCARHGQWDGKESTWERFNGLTRAQALPDDETDGTGPFAVQRYDRSQGQLWLERNERYWRKPAALKRVALREVADFATRKLMLLAGDADVITAYSTEAGQIEPSADVSVITGLRKLQDSTILAFNQKIEARENRYIGSGALDGSGIPPDFFSDLDVRLGFASAIDDATYAKDILRGQAVPGSLIPEALPGHASSRRRLDPKIAADHFKRAWGGLLWKRGFKAVLGVKAEPPEFFQLGRMIARDLAKINPKFQLDVMVLPDATATAARHRRLLPLVLTGWTADYADAHDFAFPLVHSRGLYAGYYGYSDPEADGLVEAAAAESSVSRRAALYRRLQEIVDDRALLLFLPSKLAARVQRSWVRGFVFNPARHDAPYGSYYYELSKPN